jgi:prepilin-type N-terminal cleavage/methylation domain-containing protein
MKRAQWQAGGAGIPGERRGAEIAASCRGGFTLIEVIAALVVFAIGVLFTTSLTTALSIQIRDSALRSQVVAEAQQTLDSLIVLPWASLDVGTETHAIQIQGVAYVRSIVVAPDAVLPRLRTIEVGMEPSSQGGPAFKVSSAVVQP